MEIKNTLNLNELGIKARSKIELYRLLTIEGRLYLPPCRETSTKFIQEIFSGQKQALFHEEVKVVSVPHVKGLRINDLYGFLQDQCHNGLDYIPSDYYKRSLNRNSLNESAFRQMVLDSLSQREYNFIRKHNIEIDCHPKLVEVVSQSKMISTHKGRSHMLLKPKQHKSAKSIESQIIERDQENKLKDELIDLQTQICLLQDELKARDDECKMHDTNSQILAKLYDDGVIDKDGKIINFEK